MDLHVGRALSSSRISELLHEARSRTLLLVSSLSEYDLRRQHSPLMSPIVWDLGHIAHFEEVWLLEKIEGDGPGSEGLRGMYDPFRNPRATRVGLDLPGRADAFAYMAATRRAVLERLTTVDLESSVPLLDLGFVFRMVLQHEYQHGETILQTLQLKQGEPFAAPRAVGLPTPVYSAGASASGPDMVPSPRSVAGVGDAGMVRVAAGRYPIGSDDRSVVYDNERPRHEVEVGAFEIDVTPVTNAAYLAFIDDGGYERAELWDPVGWRWRGEEGLDAPAYWGRTPEGARTERCMERTRPLDPARPVCHVCYWEADAFARWAGKRLPTEQEWEVAALWDPDAGKMRAYPWGDAPPTPMVANIDQLSFDTSPVGAYPGGVSPLGCADMIGNVWEWTSSPFVGYPGYVTFPYPEYSEVFFGDEYRVLRGGSWASRSGAVRGTFRNWDYPIRRQIFSGFRCARDL